MGHHFFELISNLSIKDKSWFEPARSALDCGSSSYRLLSLVNTPLATREEQKWRLRFLAVVRPGAATRLLQSKVALLQQSTKTKRRKLLLPHSIRRFAQVLRGVTPVLPAACGIAGKNCPLWNSFP